MIDDSCVGGEGVDIKCVVTCTIESGDSLAVTNTGCMWQVLAHSFMRYLQDRRLVH